MNVRADDVTATAHQPAANRLIQAIGAAREECIALRETLRTAREEVAKLTAQLALQRTKSLRLAQENAVLCAQLVEGGINIQRASVAFVEKYGMLWRVQRGRAADAMAYCLNCRHPLVGYPSERAALLWCSECGFVPRGVHPTDIAKLSKQVKAA